jgi:hypothetical protein
LALASPSVKVMAKLLVTEMEMASVSALVNYHPAEYSTLTGQNPEPQENPRPRSSYKEPSWAIGIKLKLIF